MSLRSPALLAILALAACHGSAPGGVDAAADGSPSAAAPADRLDEILLAEHRRLASGITEADQQSRDVAVRRAAARALSRIGGDAARPGLLRALADEDAEVIAWGAYGLGFFCKGHEKENVSALVARAVSLPAPPQGPAPRIDPPTAISRAVGRCGAEESEPTLVAWLAGPRDRAIAAALGLGDLAMAKQKLREETIVALLNVAAGSASAPPAPEALFPIGRLEHVPPSVIDRLREVATARLAEPGDGRLLVVRALGRAEAGAAPELKRVIMTPSAFSVPERVEAARGLKRIGVAGQRALAEVIPTLAPSPDPVALTALVGDEIGVLLTALNGLEIPGSARKALAEIAALPLPPSAPATIARRVSWIRCGAAKVIAGSNFRDKALLGCDVTGGAPPGADGLPVTSIGARAVVAVLGRGEITGPALAAYRLYAGNGADLRAREAALELLKEHEEIEGAAAILTDALSAKESGLVGTAAEVIAKQPPRATDVPLRKPKKSKRKKGDKGEGEAAPTAPSPALIKALLAVLARPTLTDDPEMADSVIDAVGALAIKEAMPRLDEICKSPYPTTREHTAKAIGLIGGEKRTCDAPAGGGPAPAELANLARAPVTLAFDTDVGALSITLDPALAPVVVTRVAEIARSGYYNGMIVHRVEPGYVTQFGAPYGDGFGGPEGKPAVRCETTPAPFVPLAVGIALSGRDTGSSQLFVMHSRAPHLDGQYAIVGTATGPWASFIDGDAIRSVKVTP